MFLTPKYMKRAESMLDMHENEHTRRLNAYFKKYTGWNYSVDKTPWCAAFVNAIVGEAGYKTTGSFMARSFLHWGKEVSSPRKGDVVVFSRGRPPSGHVAFYVGKYGRDHILVLGGNQRDRVCVKAYPKHRILGYRRPVK